MKGYVIGLAAVVLLMIIALSVFIGVNIGVRLSDAHLPDISVDNTAAIIQECPKLKAAVDKLTERILALEKECSRHKLYNLKKGGD